MALIIEAPNEIYSVENMHSRKLFLAGGITNCPDWQSVVIEGLKDMRGVTIYNPRRKNFPMNDPKAAEAQIAWEFNQLANADVILFWFSKGSLNPIVLYELGMWGNSSNIPMVVGCDKGYERTQDVIIQTQLARPDVEIFDDLDDVICTAAELLKPTEW